MATRLRKLRRLCNQYPDQQDEQLICLTNKKRQNFTEKKSCNPCTDCIEAFKQTLKNIKKHAELQICQLRETFISLE